MTGNPVSVFSVLSAVILMKRQATIRRLTGSSALMETVIKIPVDVGLFIASYQIQRKWVFKRST